MYKASLGCKCGARRARSSANEEVAGERVVRGVRDSFWIVQSRPRWFGESTSVLKAV
jgi:hypothetical protein